MITIAALILAVLTLQAETQQHSVPPKDNDCTLEKPGPLLKASKGLKVERVRKGPRELAETIRRQGFTAEVTQGGCTHYGVRFVFTAARRRSQTKTAEQSLITEALAFMERLKPHTDSYVITDVLAILEGRKGDSYTAGEPLQDRGYPFVTLYITARIRGGTREFELTYSFVP